MIMLMNSIKRQNCGTETGNVILLTYFLCLNDVVPEMKEELTKTFYQIFVCFAETVSLYFKDIEVS
jgi:hypothetical protein